MSASVRRVLPLLVLTLSAVLVSSSLAFAQGSTTSTTTIQTGSERHEGIGIGAKFGPLFPRFNSNDPTETFQNRTGWIGGLFIGGNRPGIVGVGVDILYARKTAGTPDGDVTFDYLEVPVLLRVNAGSSHLSGVNVYGVVGPAFDVRLKSKLSTGESINDQTQGVDVGISVGAGIEITRFLVEGRYTQGLRNIVDQSGITNEEIKTKAFAVMFGVRFN